MANVFCGYCRHYGHSGRSGRHNCFAPENYADAFDYPKSKPILHPEARNRKNDCPYFASNPTGFWNFFKFWE